MGDEDKVNELPAGGEHAQEWLPAYALNILAQQETTQVAEHLASCPACRVELHAYQAAADELPLALVQTAPHPELKDRLMRDIHSRQMKAAGTAQPLFFRNQPRIISPNCTRSVRCWRFR